MWLAIFKYDQNINWTRIQKSSCRSSAKIIIGKSNMSQENWLIFYDPFQIRQTFLSDFKELKSSIFRNIFNVILGLKF